MLFAYLSLMGRIILLGYERIIVKKLGERADSETTTFLFFAIASIFLLPFIFTIKSPAYYGFLKYTIISSFVYTVAFVLYVKSLSIGEVSLVSPLYNFNIFFLFLLTYFFLHEPFSILKLAGLILLVYGASFLNKQKNIFISLCALFTDRACLLMIGCSVLMAVGRTIDGFVVRDVHPIHYSFSIYVCITLLLFIYVLLTRKFKQAVELLRARTGTAITAGAVNSYSYLFLLFAFTKIDVSIAEPASMLGMIVTVVLAYFIFKEKIKDRLVGVVIMITGAYLLFI